MSMDEEVNLYDIQYRNDRERVYQQIREATYGHDLGQSSWITLEEAQQFLGWLELEPSSRVLEVACGAGGISCLISAQYGAIVHGVDIREEAVEAAIARCNELGLEGKVSFSVQDASRVLDFPDSSFEAIFCNDSINHLPERDKVLGDWYRLLAPKGRVLFTDPILVTGILSNEEIRIRSSIGYYLFTPPGENERLLINAGFNILRVEEATGQVEHVARRWHEARLQRREQLLEFEGQEQYGALQDFLKVTHDLAAERRLSRHAYLAQKQA
jgi:SAM-dependent methyltransferase